MSIKDFWEKIKDGRAAWLIIIILTASLAFGLGQLMSYEAKHQPVSIENIDLAAETAKQKTAWEKRVDPVGLGVKNKVISQTAAVVQASVPASESGEVVASKNGTKYYYPSCSGAKRLKASTKLTFASAAAAEKAGYSIAKGCEQ